MRKRLFILSVLLLTVCGQMWANYNNGKPDSGTRCEGNSPTTVIVDGVMYSLYSNQNYIYTYEYHTCSTSWSSNYAVAVYAEKGDTRTELTIKSTVQDGNTTYTVVAIGEQFFYYNNTATKLTIPATVRTLETFALEDNKSNLREIVIEDSGDKLECFRTTSSYGAFSWNGGLKKVYIGRILYPVGNSGDYSYAPFYKGDFTDMEVTFGPLVNYIYAYTFYGKSDNCIKSIKAMPQQPSNWGAYAFENVTSTIPVYVSYKTIDAYKADLDWKYFTNYVLDTDLCKADALNDLDAEAGENPSATVQGVVSDYKNKVNAATSGADVVTNLNAGKLAIQLQKAKDDAIAALNAEAGNAPSQTVANVRDTWIANVNNATNVDDVNTCKNNGIDAIQLQKAKDDAIAELTKAKEDNPSGAADDIFNDYKACIEDAASIDDVTAAKEKGIKALQDYVATLEAEKASAKAELDAASSKYPSANASSIVAEGKDAIQNAKSQSEVIKKKELYIDQLERAFEAELTNAKNDAINALNQAKNEYPSAASEGIVSTYTGRIKAATSTYAITAAKKEGIQALKDANELQNARKTAIAELTSAVEEYPSNAAEGIVSTYTDRINAATSTNAITAAKEEGMQALEDAYNAQKEAERLASLDAVTVTQTAVDDYSYMLEDGVKFTFDGDNVGVTVDGRDTCGFTLSETVAIKICPAHTFKLTANQDPAHTENYYSTFFTSECAYKLPDDGSVKAYIGTVGKYGGANVLNLTETDTIHAGEAVILRAQPANTADRQTGITLMPSCNRRAASPDNKLTGTDVAVDALGPDDYALTLGQNGVGFYNWNGRSLGAHKAYLTLSDGQPAPLRSFGFRFDDGTTTGIPATTVSDQSQDDAIYNLQGIPVGDSYDGIVIKDGKKYISNGPM